MKRLFVVLPFALFVVFASSPALAIPFTDVVIDASVGSGSNEAMIVFDWKTGSTPSHAFLFSWDGVATFGTAYDAIEAAVAGFDWSGGNFVSFIDYFDGSEQHETTNDGWLSFWNSADGENWVLNGVGVLEQVLVDGGWAGANPNVDPTSSWPQPPPNVPVPEPTTGLLMATALLTLCTRRRVEV